jgi:DNA-binding LacI/PurR family transcriptional regulator
MAQAQGEETHYLYEKIYNELRAEIVSGAYRKGDWFPPERVLKDRFRTTHLTVRNALAKLVLDGFIERYSGKGTMVIYSPLRSARQVPRLRVKRVHLVVARVDAANAPFLNALEEGLRRLAVPLSFSCHHDDALLEGSLCRQAAEQEALTILEPAASPGSILASGAPLPHTILFNAADSAFDGPQVVPDDADGARQAARHLLSLGHRLLGLVDADPSPRGRERLQGFEEELQGAADLREEQASPGVEGGAQACARVLAAAPSCRAFFCTTDEAAAGACRQLRGGGLRPGSDCSVAGWGNTPLAEAEGLDSVDPRMAEAAAQVLLAIRSAATHAAFPRGVTLVKPELRLRGSSCRA